MPEDLIVYRKRSKEGDTPVYLHEMGCYALVRVENGQILNSFNGQHLKRIKILSRDLVKELRAIFNGGRQTARGKG